MCLENISGDFTVNIMKNQDLNGNFYGISVDYIVIDISNIIYIRKYSMKKHDIR